ncbi:MAG TPA: nitroreductase family protein [Myxococcaceae bacterium]|nr:nitroreductase family protein [Myxococcaceae bacterium]
MSIAQRWNMSTAPPLLDVILQRRSRERFDPLRSLPEAHLLSLLEAARLAPSSYNLQPWRFLWTARGDPEFTQVLLALDPGNASWAGNASAFVIGTFTRAGRRGRPNGWAEHDLGMATAQLVLQAVASGLGAHSMAGFDAEKLRASLRIPPDLQPMTVTAIGWPAHEPLPPLERLPLERIASRGRWPSGEER